MYAVIETGGKQYRVQPGDVLDVEKLTGESNDTVEFSHVLAVADENGLRVGNPVVENAVVTAHILEQRKKKKVVVFKMKRRKGYRRKQGHRQWQSRVKILDIKQ